MASAPQQPATPLFYTELAVLNNRDHGKWNSRSTNQAKWLVNQHAVPLTVEEFPQAQRYFPIVFSVGDDPVPLALMGMNEGVNVFVDEEGALLGPTYMPAYARRYPFLLARLEPESQELSLCFDTKTDLLGEFDDGLPLFDGDKASEATKATLEFCEQFEIAGRKTQAFIEELKKHDLLMDSELTIQQEGLDQPFIYRGFQMVNEEKLRDLRGDVLRAWNQNGMLPLVMAHLFSLPLAREIFAKQVEQGKMPTPAK